MGGLMRFVCVSGLEQVDQWTISAGEMLPHFCKIDKWQPLPFTLRWVLVDMFDFNLLSVFFSIVCLMSFLTLPLVFGSQVQQQQPPRPKTLDSLFASIRNNTQQVAPVFNAHQGGRRRGGGRGGAGRGAFKTAYVWEWCLREMPLLIALESTWQCFLRALVKWLVKYLLWPLQETILAHGLHLEVPSLFDQCSLAFVPVVFVEI